MELVNSDIELKERDQDDQGATFGVENPPGATLCEDDHDV